MASKGLPPGVVSSSTIREDLKISITKTLIKLREDKGVDFVEFPSSLSNIERKYVHKIASELGLKSKSYGSDEDRKIKVTKMVTEVKPEQNDPSSRSRAPIVYRLAPKSAETLSQRLLSCSLALNPPTTGLSTASSVSPKPQPNSKKGGGSSSSPRSPFIQKNNIHKPPSAKQCASALATSYAKVQSIRSSKSEFASTQKARSSLPSFEHASSVCQLVKTNQLVLITGDTGCGKTTQVPQFLLDDPEIGPSCRIAITQPRRISAISVAERIAQERLEQVGSTVGYNIRLEAEKSSDTQILFMTPGVLIRKILADPLLEEYSHIIVDEAHERDRFTEFLLIILRDLSLRRADLKVILMSATLQTSKLSTYFGDIPHIHIGASMFPVQEFFLENVLRFTGYQSNLEALLYTEGGCNNASSTPGSSLAVSDYNAALSVVESLSSQYTCCVCGDQSLISSEQLGEHIIFCDGVNRNADYKPKELISFDKGASAFVSKLTQIVEKSSSSKSPAERPFSSSVSIEVPTRSSDSASKAIAEDLNNDDAFDESIIDNNEVSDEEDNNFSAIRSASEASAPIIDATSPADDAILRHYQYNFDDNFVDYDLILDLLRYIAKSDYASSGGVLVFLPGWDDITQLYKILVNTEQFGNERKYKVLQLHSGVSRSDQKMVFTPTKTGQSKIVLATNIAETSVTIDDIAVVIDSGRMKEKTYDPHLKLSFLKTSWISQSSCRQRKGRAGRTKPGVCFRLFSKRRYSDFPAQQDSELLRMPLEELMLQTKALGLAPGIGDEDNSIRSFLLKALDPPHPLSIVHGIKLLQSIKCLDEHENLTLVGDTVSKLPMDPRLGRFLVLGCLLGCGPSVVAGAAVMGYRDPFILTMQENQRAQVNAVKRRLAGQSTCDQLVLINAYKGFISNNKSSQYCDNNFLAKNVMMFTHELVIQMTNILKEIGIDIYKDAQTTKNDSNNFLVSSLIGCCLYPDIGIRRFDTKSFTTEKGKKARLHPSSIVSKIPNYNKQCVVPVEFMGFQDLISSGATDHSSAMLMLNNCPISAFALLISCGKLERLPQSTQPKMQPSSRPSSSDPRSNNQSHDLATIVIDDWLALQIDEKDFEIVSKCRAFLFQAIHLFASNPGQPLPGDIVAVLDAIADALVLDQQLIDRDGGNNSDNSNRNRNNSSNYGNSGSRNNSNSGSRSNSNGHSLHGSRNNSSY